MEMVLKYFFQPPNVVATSKSRSLKFSRSLAGVAKMVRLTKLLGTQVEMGLSGAAQCSCFPALLFPVHSHIVRQRNLAPEKVDPQNIPR